MLSCLATILPPEALDVHAAGTTPQNPSISGPPGGSVQFLAAPNSLRPPYLQTRQSEPAHLPLCPHAGFFSESQRSFRCAKSLASPPAKCWASIRNSVEDGRASLSTPD